MAMTPAQIRAQERYRKAMTAQYNLKLHRENDAEIIAVLERQASKNGYIRRALKAYIEQGGE